MSHPPHPSGAPIQSPHPGQSSMASLPSLDARDQRILGVLMEKQITVPSSYPLSLNSLRTACNQTSSREPLSDYSEAEVEEGLRSLRDRELVRFVWAGKGSRTVKYHQRLTEQLDLGDAERALITVLLLRGAQSAGQLRSRCERLHSFADKDSVTQTLQSLAEADTPLVSMQPRAAGQQDNRWIHLLGPVESGAPVPAAPSIDREGVLREGAAARDALVRASQDATASAWSDQDGDQIPEPDAFESWLLRQVAGRAVGPIADVGSGLGRATAVLAAAGADVTGFDFSAASVDLAAGLHPGLRFEVADFSRLLRPPAAAAWGGITAWYCVNHLAASELAPLIGSWSRVLAEGGTLALALQAGEGIITADSPDGSGQPELVLHDPQQVAAALESAGMVLDELYHCGPPPGQAWDPRASRFFAVAHKA